MANNINMPHEGGIHLLKTFFGETAKAPEAKPWVIKMYCSLTALTFNDIDTQALEQTPASNDQPVLLINMTEFASSISSMTPSDQAVARADLTSNITVINGVPQVEFPEVSITFSAALTNPFAGENIYGYAICCATEGTVIFRQLFDEPFVPFANSVNNTLTFIPTLKIGNTTCKLT